MKVLLIVDVQNDFCPGGALPVNEGDQVVPVINKLMSDGDYDLIIATRDWHPAGHISFASAHALNPFDSTVIDGVEQKVWPDHCVENTYGAEFHKDLDQERFHEIFSKGISDSFDSLSAFLDNAKKRETGLGALILSHAIRVGQSKSDIEIDVTGLAGDICAALTAEDAAVLGFKTRFILEATRPVNVTPGDDTRAIKKMIDAGVHVMSVKEVLPKKSIQLAREVPINP